MKKRDLRKTPQTILRNSLPLAITKALGYEKTKKLCTKYNYRERKHYTKCPKCKSKNVLFRSTSRTFKCRICNHISNAKARTTATVLSFALMYKVGCE
jgi:ribosomal protein L37AE/L43A